MDRQEGSEIRRLLRFKGSSRLEVKDDLTEKILEHKNIVFPGGLKFRFVESRKLSGPGGEWVEYKVLYSIIKYRQTLEYMQVVLDSIQKLLKTNLFGDLSEVSYLELSEFDSSQSEYYYVLLEMRKDLGEELKENETKELFNEYE